jgi:NADH-quinone oxidoreductase subunit J
MSFEAIAFYVLSAGAIISAFCVVVPPMGRNPLHAALSLLLTLFFVACLFVLLSAHLLAVLQILVYVGAVMVLFVFVVMLLNLQPEELKGAKITPWKVVGVALVLVFLAKSLVAVAVATQDFLPVNLEAVGKSDFGSVKVVGKELVTTYLFPFELASILLLVAILGGVLIARRHKRG